MATVIHDKSKGAYRIRSPKLAFQFYCGKGYTKRDAEARANVLTEMELDLVKSGDVFPRTLNALQQYPDLLKALQEKGIVNAAAALTLGELVEKFQNRSGLSEGTLANRRIIFQKLVDFFGASATVDTITKSSAQDFDAFLNQKVQIWQANPETRAGMAPATRAGVVKAIKTLFNWAVKNDYATANPFVLIKAGKQTNSSRQDYITEKQTKLVLEACDTTQHPEEWRALVALARYQGLRVPSETRALRWQDVDFIGTKQTHDRPSLSIYSQKTKTRRVMPLFPETAEELKRLRDKQQEQDAVDPYPGGDFVFRRLRIQSDNLRTTFSKIIYRAGLEQWPRLFQNLRASAATDIREKFGETAENKWVGHGAAIAENHYYQVTPETWGRATTKGLIPEEA